MNWVYVIPVIGLLIVAMYTPLQVVGAIVGVVAVCLGAVWLQSKIMR